MDRPCLVSRSLILNLSLITQADAANIKAFSACLNIKENYSDQSFTVQAHSTNRYKVKWMIDAFIDAYEEHEAKLNSEKHKRCVKDSNEERYEASLEVALST